MSLLLLFIITRVCVVVALLSSAAAKPRERWIHPKRRVLLGGARPTGPGYARSTPFRLVLPLFFVLSFFNAGRVFCLQVPYTPLCAPMHPGTPRMLCTFCLQTARTLQPLLPRYLQALSHRRIALGCHDATLKLRTRT